MPFNAVLGHLALKFFSWPKHDGRHSISVLDLFSLAKPRITFEKLNRTLPNCR